MDEHDPTRKSSTQAEEQTQREIREEAAGETADPITRREGLESELLEDGASDAGEAIGDEMP